MERQASENNEKPTDILQSMMIKLKTNESLETHNGESQVDPNMNRQNSSLEIKEETTCKEHNEYSNVRSDAVGEPPTKTLETDEVNEAVLDFPKWERKSLLFPITTSLSEDVKILGTEEPTEIAALSLNNQKESPARQSHASPFHLSTSSESHDFSQSWLKNEACDNQPKLLWGGGATIQSNYQIHDNVNRTARSVSDPVVRKPKEQRPLSAPSISEFAMKKFTGNASAQKGRKDSGEEESFGDFEKSKNKGMKSKMKICTLRVMEMLKENRSREHNDSKNSQDCVEKEIESINSLEVELEALSPPPLPHKKGRYVRLERTFTLKDFKLDLEPINLMDEIFTGEEWLPFLPSKTSQTNQDAGDKAMVDNINRPEEDAQIHVSQPTTKQNQPEDNRLDKKQHFINTEETISELESVTKVNNHIYAKEIESDGDIIAIPKALVINPAKQQRVCGIYQSGDIFDCRGKYVIPKHDFLLVQRKSADVASDFSAVQPSVLLDNSALKSRIRLSKKRPHRPPKKHRKLKTDCKFYKIPSVYLKESVSDSSSIDYMPISMSPPLHSNPCPAKC